MIIWKIVKIMNMKKLVLMNSRKKKKRKMKNKIIIKM